MKAERKKYLQTWREQNKQAGKLYRQRRSSDWRKTLEKIKLATGCWRCGYKKSPAALHFHHVDPELKERGVPDMWSSSRINKLLEIRKCEVLCANCHEEEHS